MGARRVGAVGASLFDMDKCSPLTADVNLDNVARSGRWNVDAPAIDQRHAIARRSNVIDPRGDATRWALRLFFPMPT